MNMKNYPNWKKGGTPDTDPNAKVIAKKKVDGVEAIKVVGGKYRGASLDGIFEVVKPSTTDKNGKVQIEVCCAWHGVKPPNNYPQLDITDADVKRLPNHTADDVVDNIGKDESVKIAHKKCM